MATPGNTDREQSDADQTVVIGKLDEVIQSNTDVALAMVAHQERAKLAEQRFRSTIKTILVSACAVVVVLLAALIVVSAFVLEAVSGSRGARDQILSCVTPGHSCYQQGQDRTAAAVAAIVQAITANDQQIAARAAACAPEYVTLPSRQRTHAIYVCIVRSK